MLTKGWSITQLSHLAEVASGPTWTDAADRLGITQSALSQSLGELERRLGMDLFERRGRRRVLTSAGRLVLNEAERVLAVATDLERTADALATGDAGPLRVGMIDTAALRVLPEAIHSFRSEHEGVDLHLVVDSLIDLLSRNNAGDLDMAVVVQPPSLDPGILATPLMTEALHVFAPPGTASCPPATWGPWSMFPARSTTRGIIERALTDLGVELRVVTDSPNPEVLRQMVRLGLGWTVLPVSEAGSGAGALVPFRRRAIASRDLVVARREGAPHDPRTDAFIELASRAVARGRRRPKAATRTVCPS